MKNDGGPQKMVYFILFEFINSNTFLIPLIPSKRGKTGKEGPKNIFPFTLVLIPIFSYHLPNVPLREL